MQKKTKKALLSFDKFDPNYVDIERELAKKNFEVIRVNTLERFLEKTKTELCQVYIHFYSDEKHLREILDKTRNHLQSRLTPKVFIGPPLVMKNEEHSSILNQSFTLDTGKELIAEFCDETYELFYRETRKVKIEPGNVAKIIAGVSMLRFTGILEFENEEERCSIYFVDGKIVCASSSRSDKRFGQLLLQHGLVTPDQIDKVTALLVNQRKRVGQLFVESGIISNKKLLEMLELQIKHIVMPIFNWEFGGVEIIFDLEVHENEFPIQVDAFKLVSEGVKLRFSEQELLRFVSPTQKSIVYCGGNFDFTEKEFNCIEIVKSKSPTIDSLLSYEKFTKIELLRTIYLLASFGVLDFKEPSTVASKREVEKKKDIHELFSEPNETVPNIIEKSSNRSHKVLLTALFLSALVLFIDQWINAPEIAGVAKKEIVTVAATQPPAPRIVATQVPTPIETKKPMTQESNAVKTETEKIANTAKLMPKPTPKPSNINKMTIAKRFVASQHYAEAQQICEQMLQENPANEEALLLLGTVYMEQDSYDKAEKTYLKIISREPEQVEAHLNLGTIYIHEEKYKKAKEHLDHFLSHVRNSKENQAKIREVQKVLQSLQASQ